MSEQNSKNIVQLNVFSADDMLAEIADLRSRILTAWRERGVMLTRDEQNRLLAEIRETCFLLGDLAP